MPGPLSFMGESRPKMDQARKAVASGSEMTG